MSSVGGQPGTTGKLPVSLAGGPEHTSLPRDYSTPSSDIKIAEASMTPKDSGVSRILNKAGSFWTLGVLILILLAFALTTPNFLSLNTWVAVSVSAAAVGLLAVGQTFVIISRGIDLSVGSVLGMSGMLAAFVMRELISTVPNDLNILIGALVCIMAGGVVGLVNGLVITRLNVTPFVATLGMLGIAAGITQLVNGAQQIAEVPSNLGSVGNTVLFGRLLPVPVLITAILAIIAAVGLRYTRFGRRTYAIGSNPEAALRTGINVSRHQVMVYVISGGFAGAAGFLVLTQLTVASVQAGLGSELEAIAAVVIGGASLFGGRGNIAGGIIGTLIVAVLATGLIVARVPTAWQVIAIGVVLIFAVWMDQQRVRLASRES